MIKIDIISGFLGAGKTTLIKKLFEADFSKEKVVIIENEFGDIGIDSGFLKNSGVQIKEINSGCICCSLVGDFSTSIKELIEKFQPTRIIIEPSGVGKLSDIINAINNLNDKEIKLNILATVVDAKKTKVYLKNFGEFFLNQIESANSIILSKVDDLSEEKIEETLDIVKDHNPQANIITTSLSEISGEKLLKVLEEHPAKDELLEEHHCHHEHGECCHHHEHEHHEHEECCHHDHHEHEECCHNHHDHEGKECCHHDHHEHGDHECHCHHHHDADEVFTSWGLETAKSISKDKLVAFLEALSKNEDYGMIVRAKGFLKANDDAKWYYFDYVSGDYQIRTDDPNYTGKLVVIGSNINEKKLEELFKSL